MQLCGVALCVQEAIVNSITKAAENSFADKFLAGKGDFHLF
jgi:hypothetical protein